MCNQQSFQAVFLQEKGFFSNFVPLYEGFARKSHAFHPHQHPSGRRCTSGSRPQWRSRLRVPCKDARQHRLPSRGCPLQLPPSGRRKHARRAIRGSTMPTNGMGTPQDRLQHRRICPNTKGEHRDGSERTQV